MSRAYTPQSEHLSRHSAIAPRGSKTYYEDRRPLSPVTSFLDQIELGNSRLPKAPGATPQGYRTDRHGQYLQPDDQNRGYQVNRDTLASRSVPSNALKRPAQSRVQSPEDDNAIKRPRKTVAEGKFPTKPDASAKPAASIEERTQPKIQHARHQLQEVQPVKDVKRAGNTQTENIPIPSSKLAALQEEEAIAQAKHEADMARRKQALALELEHESKVLELRYRFELPTAKGAQSASATIGPYSPEHPATLPIQKPTTENVSRNEGTNSIQIASSGEEIKQPTQDSSITRTSGDAPVAVQGFPKPESAGQMRFSTAEATSDPFNPPNAKEPKSTTETQAKGRGSNQSVLESKDRHGSSSSASVQIKTSVSPGAVERGKLDVNKPRWPKVTHLTCYFWKNGYCTKSAAECSYAHHDTGLVATAPDTMKRTRRHGVCHNLRGW
ncbi:MAG: hypothetical protein Q9211_004081 [Gyalolechia sp. 1 TL-2023]